MSIQSAEAFIERLKTDEEFRNRITKAETAEARKAIIKAEGFEFTKEDIKKGMELLTDDELDQVAGGGIDFDRLYTVLSDAINKSAQELNERLNRMSK